MNNVAYENPAQIVLRRFFLHRFAPFALLVFCLILCASIFAFLSRYTPTQQDPHEAYQPPSTQHWFGTDELGRDVFTRILYGGRISLSVGLLATTLTLTIGIFIGAISGYYGGWLDNILMRITDAFLSFPVVLVLILISSLLREMPLIIMLSGIYYGVAYGGTVTSVLMRIPGEASSVMTCIDGNAMARRGRAGAAAAVDALRGVPAPVELLLGGGGGEAAVGVCRAGVSTADVHADHSRNSAAGPVLSCVRDRVAFRGLNQTTLWGSG